MKGFHKRVTEGMVKGSSFRTGVARVQGSACSVLGSHRFSVPGLFSSFLFSHRVLAFCNTHGVAPYISPRLRVLKCLSFQAVPRCPSTYCSTGSHRHELRHLKPEVGCERRCHSSGGRKANYTMSAWNISSQSQVHRHSYPGYLTAVKLHVYRY